MKRWNFSARLQKERRRGVCAASRCLNSARARRYLLLAFTALHWRARTRLSATAEGENPRWDAFPVLAGSRHICPNTFVELSLCAAVVLLAHVAHRLMNEPVGGARLPTRPRCLWLRERELPESDRLTQDLINWRATAVRAGTVLNVKTSPRMLRYKLQVMLDSYSLTHETWLLGISVCNYYARHRCCSTSTADAALRCSSHTQ
jgi:hypothetical protein